MDGEGPVAHGAEPANHDGGNGVPRAGVRIGQAQGDADHVKVDEVLDLESHGAAAVVLHGHGTEKIAKRVHMVTLENTLIPYALYSSLSPASRRSSLSEQNTLRYCFLRSFA